VSVTGGEGPVWSRSGRQIFFVNGSQFLAATVETAGSFAVTKREVLFDRTFEPGGGHPGYDIAPNGKSLLMLLPVARESERIVVVRNLAAELRAGPATATGK
jgi:hypothetical protein